MMEIREIRQDEALAARQVMFRVCNELWGDSEEQTLQYDPLLDYEALPESYRENGGIFLVVVDDGEVVGSGGIRLYKDRIAELKRMWLLSGYRGRGLGKALMGRLVDFAREAGYERIWLELGTPDIQPEALGLYRLFGFHPIPVYAHPVCELAMEKVIGRANVHHRATERMEI